MLSTPQKILIARLLSKVICSIRICLGIDQYSRVSRMGINWDLDLKEGIDLSIYLLGGFEPNTITCYASEIKNGDVVIDIGANIGAHSLPMAKLVGSNGLVITFEPTEFAYQKQIKNISLNLDLLSRIKTNQTMLVGDSNANLPDLIHSSWPMESSADLDKGHLGRLKSTEGANAISLDQYIEENSINKINFIKLDVDGFELDVLNGGGKVIAKFRPKILLELAPYVFHNEPNKFNQFIKILTDKGYCFFELSSKKLLPSECEALLKIIPKNGSINVLAIYKE